LTAALENGAGMALITEESLRSADVTPLSRWLKQQPEWSDFPFILLTERGGSLERNPAAARYLDMLGNVTFIERPFHAMTFISLAQSALRGRRRQYEARARLQSIYESEYKFRNLADSIPTLCWMANPDGNIFWYNQRWYEYTGTTPQQMEGWGWQMVHDENVLPEVLTRWKESLATGEPFEMVFPLKGADGAFRAFLTRIAPIRDAEGRIARWFGTNTDISAQQRGEEHLNFLMNEISHRSKNLLAVIQSMIRQIARGSTDVTEFAARLGERLQGLAFTHDQLVDGNWQGATLQQLLVRQLANFVSDKKRVELDGPEIQLKPKAAEALGLAFHELATNAAKYGALSQPSGTIKVEWDVVRGGDAHKVLRLVWRERGGPAVVAPKGNGFGTVVLTRVAASTLSGKVDLEYVPEGVSWSIECPADQAIVA
jgi:PAS domain S-box-containing protein